MDSHPESQSLGLDTLPSSWGSSLSSVSFETLANDVQVEEETHLQASDMLQASMQDFLMAIQAKTQHKYNRLQPAARTAHKHKQKNHEPTKKIHTAGYQDIPSFFQTQPRTDLASEGGICGHSKKLTVAQGPSEGGNKGAHASSQGHPELELELELEDEQGEDGVVLDTAQGGC